jgi:transcription-repair coupling factor (superfamily II helicase)
VVLDFADHEFDVLVCTTIVESGIDMPTVNTLVVDRSDLLGQAQSGHIAAVGFDLYCQMVTDAVGELKGEPVAEPSEITVDVPVDANLPRDYVTRDDVRMEAYRRLAAVTTPEDVDDILSEWVDRYGPPPESAAALLDVARLRAAAVRLGIRAVTVQKGTARILGLELRESQKVRLRRLAPKAVAKDGGEVVIPVAVPRREVAGALVALLDELVPAEPALASAAP